MARAPKNGRPAAAGTLTLTLLRHAKASRDEPESGDIGRALTGRGRRNADAVGQWMASAKHLPELVLCSTATRTRETLELVLPHLATAKPKVSYADRLYLAGPLTLLKTLHESPKRTHHLMLIGHNPGLHALALDLVADGPQDRIAALGRKLPTSGLVAISFPLANWTDVVAGSGTLVAFNAPSDGE